MQTAWETVWGTPRPARRGFGARLRRQVLGRSDNPHGVNHCWHCGTSLLEEGTWHVDHHPIPYRDIWDQLCCGVTDEHALHNLKPTCVSCNTSHAFEPRDRRLFCGRTQPCCLKSVFRRVCLIAMGALSVGLAWALVTLGHGGCGAAAQE